MVPEEENFLQRQVAHCTPQHLYHSAKLYRERPQARMIWCLKSVKFVRYDSFSTVLRPACFVSSKPTVYTMRFYCAVHYKVFFYNIWNDFLCTGKGVLHKYIQASCASNKITNKHELPAVFLNSISFSFTCIWKWFPQRRVFSSDVFLLTSGNGLPVIFGTLLRAVFEIMICSPRSSLGCIAAHYDLMYRKGS